MNKVFFSPTLIPKLVAKVWLVHNISRSFDPELGDLAVMGVVISSVVAAGPAVLGDLETPYNVLKERQNRENEPVKLKHKYKLRRQPNQIHFEALNPKWVNYNFPRPGYWEVRSLIIRNYMFSYNTMFV